MHTIWLAIIVPAMVSSVWIVPKLRTAKLWIVFFLLAFLGSAIWVGIDLYQFIDTQESSKGVWRRAIYLFLSENDIPALQFTFGALMAGLFSKRFAK